MQLQLYQVRYFLALARTLNFTRAAEQCNVTQPALTKAVQKLEQELGGPLIHRERHLTQLTELGKMILPTLEKIFSAAEAVRIQAQGYQKKTIAPLKIGLVPSVSAALITELLLDLVRTIPDLRLDLHEADANGLVAMLLDGQINAALVGDAVDRPIQAGLFCRSSRSESRPQERSGKSAPANGGCRLWRDLGAGTRPSASVARRYPDRGRPSPASSTAFGRGWKAVFAGA